MDNRDKEEFIENLNAILAAAYSGGNSFAARSARARLQRRDDEGKFAEMFGTMRLVMLLNGLPVAGYGKYVGASTRKGPDGSDNMGWVYVNPDKNFPNGKFIRVPMDKVNMFDGEDGGVALLGEDYLKEKGIDPKNPSFTAGMLNFDDLESQDYPPGFMPHPRVGGAFISEDGDITIEPDGNGGWDVIDNLDREAPARNVATLPDALEQVYEIDKTRTNYEGAEGETKTPETPVAELPTTPEAPKADPAGMTNKDLGEEVARFERIYGGRTTGMDEEVRARYDAVSDEWELRIDEHEDQFENPDFVRDASKATAPVAVLPSDESKLDNQIAEIQAKSITDEGVTYSILGADAPTDGYMVSHKAIVDPVDKDVFEGEGGKQALFDFITKAKDLGFFQSDNEFVGVWLDSDTNKYYLDVSENVADLDEAKRLGVERDQIAIWDIVNSVPINVGGTGEREETDSGAKPDGQDGSRDSGDNRQPVGESSGEVVEQAESDVQKSEQVVEETADPATVDIAEEVIATEAPIVEQATIKPPRAPREPSIGAFTGKMAELLDGVTDPKQVQDIINGEEITYIDFETSGFSAVPGDGALNRPLQMGIVKVKNGEVTERRNLWMNPEEPLAEWSKNNLKDADGNPLTDEWLATQPSMQDAFQEAVAFIGPDAILGGQNVQFDLEVLTRSLREQGIDFSFAGTIDSRDLGKKTLPTWSPESPVGPTKTDADGNKSASNSLGDLIAFLKDDGYDVTLDNWHSADADAQATHELVQALLQRAVDNNVDMGILTDKAQRDAESASEWSNYANEYDTYVADLGNYFNLTNDPNKDARLALAEPLTPGSFGLVDGSGLAARRDGGQTPVTPGANIPSKKLEDYTDEEIKELARQEQANNSRTRTDGMIGMNVSTRYANELSRRGLSLFEVFDGGGGGKPPTPPVTPPAPEDGGESIDDLLTRLDLVNDDDFINKAVDTMFDPEDGNMSVVTDEYEFSASVDINTLQQYGSFDGFLEVFDPQGGESEIFNISFPMSGFESLGEQYTRAQMAQKIKEALAEAGVGIVSRPAISEQLKSDLVQISSDADAKADTPAKKRRARAVQSVKDAVGSETPVVVDPDTETPETSTETVQEILPAPEFRNLGEVINGTPNSAVLRRAKELDEVSENDLVGALAYILSNERNTAVINGKNYAPTVIIAALSRRGFDTDMFIAKKLDEKSGRTENVDALNTYRAENADVIGESGEQGDQDPVDTFLKNASRDILTALYVVAVLNGRDSVAINLADFGAPSALGLKMIEISVADFRKKLEDAGIDVDSLDNGFQDNNDSKQEIADGLGTTPDELEPSPRTDWRQVIRRNDYEFSDVFYYDKKGDYHHLERRDDGLWHRKNAPVGNGIGNEALIRKMERNADPNRNIEIDDGEPQDEETDYLYYNANNIFRIGGAEAEFVEGAPSAPVIRRMMNVVGGDISQIEAEEKAGRPVNIMDAIREQFPDAKEGEDGELITEVHEWTGEDGTKYRYEVVIVRTADEYYYTYIRQTNLTENVAWSARLGVMSQSATAVLNAYRTNVRSFTMSFFRPGGPVGWMESNARKKSRRRDVWDEESKKWIHLKEIQNNPQTRANLKSLLGETPATNAQVRAAEDEFFKDILDGVTKWRMNDTKLQIFARNKGVTLDYLYRVIGAYDAHLANQANIEGYGTWVSADQKTPLDAGDIIEHTSGRRGVVRKRIGFVDSLGRYRYTDYVEVRWDNGDISWTTSRKNRLIRTVDGTDGSERINYKNPPTDPRAGEGASVKQPDEIPVPQSDPLPANPQKQVRVVATRNENSELTLPDGTIVPELSTAGGAATHNAKRAESLEVGDFVGTLNSDMEYVNAPILSAPVLSEDGSKYNVDVVVRESDGTYSVNTLSFPASDRQQVLATTPVNNDTENSATPAQLNELVELLGSKDLSGRDWTDVIEYYAGEPDARTFTALEIADIIQELRALPSRESNPVQDLADFARQASDDAARSNNQEAAQNFEFLADAGDIIASQSPSAEAPTESTPEAPSAPETAEPAQPASPMDKASFVDEIVRLQPDILEAIANLSRSNFREWLNTVEQLYRDGVVDDFGREWLSRYALRLGNRLSQIEPRVNFGAENRDRFARILEMQDDSRFEEFKYEFQDTLRFLNTYASTLSDESLSLMMGSEESRQIAEYFQKIKENPIQFVDERVLASNVDAVEASYSAGETERAQKARDIRDAYNAGYEVIIPTNTSEAPDASLNQVIFVTLSDGTRAVLKYLTGASVATDEVKNELAIGRTFEELGVKTPAMTVVVGPSGEEAMLSAFIDDAEIAYRAVDVYDADEVRALENMDIVSLMDLAIGNADRHEKNWFVNPETEEVYPIDHGLINETGIKNKRDIGEWMQYIADAGAYYPGFHDIITDFLRGNRLDIDEELLSSTAERLSSLRQMYESMGRLDLYTQMFDTINIMLGISRQ